MCDLVLVLHLHELEDQVRTNQLVVGSLMATGRWPEDAENPSLSEARAGFFELLHAPVDGPAETAQLTGPELERAELEQVLGVGRGRR